MSFFGLSHVDVPVRDLERAAAFYGRNSDFQNAEYLAAGQRPVTRDDVVRAYIISNAKITRERVRPPLQDHGFDPGDYPEEFES